MFCEQTWLIRCMCTCAVITEDYKTNGFMLRDLMVQNCFEKVFFFRSEVQVSVFKWLRVVQNHTMKQCEFTNGSPEIVGIV